MNTAPLSGIKVIDFTEVQSGPSCTQMLAWLGADVIKIERPGVGDATRKELQFDPDCPSYYYLQLNSDKKSLALNAKTPDGKAILTKLISTCDIFVENLHPGAMDKLGFSWEEVHKLNPKCIYGTIKGFPESSKYKDLKAYEPVAQATAAAASTTGWYEGEYNIPTQSGAALGDSNTGMHLLIGLLAALQQRNRTGEFMQYPDGKFGDCVPRSGNTEGSGVLGWTYKCKPSGGLDSAEDANNFAYIILQRGAKDFEKACEAFGFQDWLTDPDFNTADARDRHKDEIIKRIAAWTADKTKYEVTELLSKYDVPVGPVLSTKEMMSDESLYDGNTLVRIDNGGKVGEFVTVGCPFTMSSYQPEYGPAPLEIGQDTDDVLKSYGYTDAQIAEFAANGTTAPAKSE